MNGNLNPEEEPDAREDTLPKWAQQKLGLLRQRLAEERAHSASLRGDVAVTDTFIRWHGIREDHLLLPRSEISFVPDTKRPHHMIDCVLRDGALHVHGTASLVVRPVMNNDITIVLGNR